MKKTVLYDLHVSLGAKMAAFGGYEMPLQYEGIIREHGAARAGAAVFDTCHMGEFLIRGAGALAGLERVLSCDVADIRVGSCRYGFICNDAGGVIDDLIIYRLAEDEFMMVVNAATEAGDFEWVAARVSGEVSVENISRETGKIDLQGPGSPKIAAALFGDSIAGLRYYNFARGSCRGADVIVSRTGYTGEIGFEVYCPIGAAKDFWNDCIERGAVPAGLGARDALRLEMGYPLYGRELSEGRNAAQSDFTRAVSRKKAFIGSESVLDPSAGGQLLRGISLDGRRAARGGEVVLNGVGAAVGEVTSGSFAPSLGHAVALAYIDKEYSAAGTELRVAVGSGEIAGRISELPFYKNATARADINLFL